MAGIKLPKTPLGLVETPPLRNHVVKSNPRVDDQTRLNFSHNSYSNDLIAPNPTEIDVYSALPVAAASIVRLTPAPALTNSMYWNHVILYRVCFLFYRKDT